MLHPCISYAMLRTPGGCLGCVESTVTSHGVESTVISSHVLSNHGGDGEHCDLCHPEGPLPSAQRHCIG